MAGLDSTIVAGYTAQKQSLAARLARTTTAAYEIINNNAGSLTVAVMHPFSRGTCQIQSADPFQPPAIDPRWLSNPVDRQVLVEALFFNRQILATPPMLELQAAQFVPPIEANEDAINQVINNGLRTEFHPSGTLAMLPLEQGGVVDSHLRVWGTQNLRIVDASIFPMIPAAHLQAVVYGVAEKVGSLAFVPPEILLIFLEAADIIKADDLPAGSIPTSSSSSQANPTVVLLAASGLNQSTNLSSIPNSRITPSMTTISISFSPSEAASNIPVSQPSSTVSHATNPPMTPSLSSPIFSLPSQSTNPAAQSASAAEDLVTRSSSTPSSTSDIRTTLSLAPPSSDLLSPSVAAASTATFVSDSTMSAPSTSMSGASGYANSSVVALLTSAGVPSAIVASLVPGFTGSSLEATPKALDTLTSSETDLKQRAAVLDGLIQRLLKVFT